MGMTMWYQGDPKDLVPHHWLWRCYIRAILKIWFAGSARYLHRPLNFTIFRGWKTPSVWHCAAVALCVAASGLLGAVRGETSMTSPWLHYPAVCDHSKALLGVRAETPSADELPPIKWLLLMFSMFWTSPHDHVRAQTPSHPKLWFTVCLFFTLRSMISLGGGVVRV